jgi:hypothetical protein
MRNERRLPQETTPEGPPMESTAARRVVSRPAPRVSSNSGLRGSKRDPAPKVTVDDVVSRLEGAKGAANGSWSARCPAHEDGSPSLSVRAGDHGGVIVKCHAGCTFEAICEALEFEPGQLCADQVTRDRSPRRPAAAVPKAAPTRRVYSTDAEAENAALAAVQKAKSPSWALTHRHRYLDRDHVERMRMLRFELPGSGDKTLRPIHPRDGGWTFGDPPGLLPLYRLNELRLDERIFVVEGEKAADAGAAIGLNVTTSAHGAQSAAKSDWKPIAGVAVVILPDNDAQGAHYAESVRAQIAQISPSVELRIVELPGLPEHGDLFDFIAESRAAGRGEDEVLESIQALADAAKAEHDAHASSLPSTDGRPEIRLEPGELHRVVDEAEAALLSHSADKIFRFGEELVRVDIPPPLAGVPPQPRITALTAPNLAEDITRAAKLVRFDQRSDGYRRSDCPDKVATSLLHRRGRWRAPELTGLISAPALRADGSIVDQPGYDATSGLLFAPGGVEFPSISAQPTPTDARAALDALGELVRDFPFVDPADRAAALALLVTACVRRTLRSAPMFAIRAPTMGSGKSLLARLAGILASGRMPGVVGVPPGNDERRKTYLALLLEGEPVIVLDNISEPFEDDNLCSILTEPRWKSRVLGVSRSATVPTNALWIVTGNNLVIRGDLTTRVVPCDLDPRCERPEERAFDRDLDSWAATHRPRLVVAALTVVRAYVVAGSPSQRLPVFGRFERWSETVRSALVWCGELDPCAGRKRLESVDPIRDSLREALQGWNGVFGARPVRVADAIKDLPQLRGLFLDLAPGQRPGEIDPRKLGLWLQRVERRIEGGLRFERGGIRGGSATWRVCGA